MIIAIGLLGATPYYTEQEAQTLFAQGNDAYANGNFDQAREAYQRLIEAGLDSPDVLYNLGTAELSRQDLGNAVLHLERAKKAGKSEDIDANLAVARSRQLDQVVTLYFEKAFVQRIVDATSENLVAWIFVSSWFLAFTALVLKRVLVKNVKTLSIVSAFCFAIAIPSGLLVWGHLHVRRSVLEAVVLSPAAAAREFPKETLKPLFEVHAGLKVQVLEDSGKYVRIRLPNGLEGWTEKSGLAEI